MKFSLLISIYHKEKVAYLNRAMQSIWNEQTTKPDEVILIQDGKLTEALYRAIDSWKKELGDTLKVVILANNVGLGKALNIGLKSCKYGLIARMDTDDIALSDRFEKQLKVFNTSDIDICSSWISEFKTDEKKISSCKRLPERHQDIVDFSKKRNPINHPAVMYKKVLLEKAGGYQDMPWFEDYYLWARMILVGAKFYNIQESLVYMRAGDEQLSRRSGYKYVQAEYNLMNRLRTIGFLTNYEFIRNVCSRFFVRVLPKKLLKQVYKIVLRS